MPSDNPSFRLEPVVEADIPAIAAVADASFKDDRHTQLKASHPTKPYDHGAGMPDAYRSWLSLPKDRIEFIKAVDVHTGEILGSVCWGKRLATPPPSIPPPKDAEKDSTNNEDGEESRPATSHDPGATPEEQALKDLTDFTSAHLATTMARDCPPGTRCMYIVSINVHPSHQGRGVGTALIRCGTDIADREGVFCWVHASEAGAPMFQRQGFEEVHHLTIDLDEWARRFGVGAPPERFSGGGGGSDGAGKWGLYTFRYLIRQPRSVRSRGVSVGDEVDV